MAADINDIERRIANLEVLVDRLITAHNSHTHGFRTKEDQKFTQDVKEVGNKVSK
jgi:hypothetical protein